MLDYAAAMNEMMRHENCMMILDTLNNERQTERKNKDKESTDRTKQHNNSTLNCSRAHTGTGKNDDINQ